MVRLLTPYNGVGVEDVCARVLMLHAQSRLGLGLCSAFPWRIGHIFIVIHENCMITVFIWKESCKCWIAVFIWKGSGKCWIAVLIWK